MGTFSRLGLAALLLLAAPAQAALYAPGETLDPACAPLDAGCGVSSVVGTGVQGQVPYYAANGGVLSATSSISILTDGDVSLAHALIVGDAEGTRANLKLGYASLTDTSSTITIATWGDSMTSGGYPALLTNISGYPTFNGGVGGETSTQIKARMLAATDKYGLPTIIWAGRNNGSDTATVKADIAAMVAALTTDNYLVLGIVNSSTEPEGSGLYNTIIQLNEDLADTYGSHYIDIRSYLVSQYDPSIPQDVTDHENDVTPSSLRGDTLHLNTAGNQKVAQKVYENIAVLTDTSPTIVTSSLLSYLFSRPPVIGSTTPNLAYFSRAAVGTTTVNTTLDLDGGTFLAKLRFDVRSYDADIKMYAAATASSNMYNSWTLHANQGSTNYFSLRGSSASSTPGAESLTDYLRMYNDGTFSIGYLTRTNSQVSIGSTTASAGEYQGLRIFSPADTTGTAGSKITFSNFSDTSNQAAEIVAIREGGSYSTSLVLKTNSGSGLTSISEKMRIRGNGNVGIGTTNPGRKLDLSQTDSSNALLRLTSLASTTGTSYESAMEFYSVPTNATGALLSGRIASNFTGTGYTSTVLKLQTITTGGAAVDTLNLTNGRVGVATTSPWRTFSVNGTVAFSGISTTTGNGSLCLTTTGDVVYNAASDSCLSSTRETKHSITSLALSELEMLQKLNPVSFVYNGDETERLRYGFIADEADAIDPHLATRDMEGKLSGLDTSAFIALIVGAVQELSDKVEGFANSFTTKDLNAQKLCLGSTCVTEAELQQFLNQSNQQSVTPTAPAAPAEPEPSVPAAPQEPAVPQPPEEPAAPQEPVLPSAEPVSSEAAL